MQPVKYTGYKDSLLDFNDEAQTFETQSKFDKSFKIVIVNASTADQVVILNPSRNPSAPLRVIKDGNIAYVSGASDLSASAEPNNVTNNPIYELIEFLKQNPTRVVKLKIQSNNSEQLSKSLNFTYRNPFANPATERIVIDKYTDQYSTNDKLVTVSKEFQLDNDTELSITVPKAVGGVSTTTTFTFNFGVSLNLATGLRNKRAMSV